MLCKRDVGSTVLSVTDEKIGSSWSTDEFWRWFERFPFGLLLAWFGDDLRILVYENEVGDGWMC